MKNERTRWDAIGEMVVSSLMFTEADPPCSHEVRICSKALAAGIAEAIELEMVRERENIAAIFERSGDNVRGLEAVLCKRDGIKPDIAARIGLEMTLAFEAAAYHVRFRNEGLTKPLGTAEGRFSSEDPLDVATAEATIITMAADECLTRVVTNIKDHDKVDARASYEKLKHIQDAIYKALKRLEEEGLIRTKLGQVVRGRAK